MNDVIIFSFGFFCSICGFTLSTILINQLISVNTKIPYTLIVINSTTLYLVIRCLKLLKLL